MWFSTMTAPGIFCKMRVKGWYMEDQATKEVPSMKWAICLILVGLLAGTVSVACAPSRDTPVPTASEPEVGDSRIRPADGAVMVFVPAGQFQMGSTDADPDGRNEEKPAHTVTLDAFWIDKTEVTNGQYRQCVAAGACEEPSCWGNGDLNAADQPVVCITWEDAQAYAVWAGGRLPTEAEWEKAARGTDGRLYPWGDDAPDCRAANHKGCVGRTATVGSYPDGASPYGALDMAGNVWEWVADRYDEVYYSAEPTDNPQGPDAGERRVTRGGSFDMSGYRLRTAYRTGNLPAYSNWDVGFRVVLPADPSAP
jgi:formylglycine-generating enzyme required for sulfatase activity